VLCPDGWTFVGSLSQSFGFVPTDARDRLLALEGSEDGIDVYRDRVSGERVFAGRTSAARTRNTSGPAPQPARLHSIGDELASWLQDRCSVEIARRLAAMVGYNDSPLFGAKKKKLRLISELTSIHAALA